MVPFKGNIHFRVYNSNKPDKHGIKISNFVTPLMDIAVALIYVGENGNQTVSKYGKTRNSLVSLLENYKKQRYTIYMDNFHTPPIYFKT